MDNTDHPSCARQTLLAATEALMYAGGINATGMDAIVKASGVGRTTIYRHFGTKDALVAQALRERKWNKELDYRLIKELWAYSDKRVAVRYAYKWHDDAGNWFRSYGNENWEFSPEGLMTHRHAWLNDMPIKASERLFHWPLGCRPDHHPALSALGL